MCEYCRQMLFCCWKNIISWNIDFTKCKITHIRSAMDGWINGIQYSPLQSRKSNLKHLILPRVPFERCMFFKTSDPEHLMNLLISKWEEEKKWQPGDIQDRRKKKHNQRKLKPKPTGHEFWFHFKYTSTKFNMESGFNWKALTFSSSNDLMRVASAWH